MKFLDPQVSRVLDATAHLLNRRLGLTTENAESDFTVFSRMLPGIERVVIRDLDERAYTEEERAFLKEIADLMLNDIIASDEASALEQRLRILERENVDLSLRNRALAEISSRDSLTGLYNRWYVLEKVEAEMNRCLRHGSPLSILMLDVDQFRHINETHGHSVADQVLQTVGRLLRESCRIYDIPGRYGGEEFCLMLPETSIDRTVPVAERIRQRIQAAHISAGDSLVQITASIGLTGLESVPEEAIFGASALLERADRARHAARDRGRNRVEVWTAGMAPRPAEAS